MIGLIFISLFCFDSLPGRGLQVSVIYSMAVLAFFVCSKPNGYTFLSRLMLLIYIAPFFATLWYIFDDQFFWWNTLSAIQVQSNDQTIRLMLAIGIIGFAGFCTGLLFALAISSSSKKNMILHTTVSDGLVLPNFLLFTLVSIFFSWISSPSDTIFSKSYSMIFDKGTLAESIKFGSAAFISFLIISILSLDATRQTPSKKRTVKFTILAVAIFFAVVYFQLMRGHRMGTGLVVALGIIFFPKIYNSIGEGKKISFNLICSTIVLAFFFILSSLNYYRNLLADDEFVIIDPAASLGKSLLFENTWTASLLTTLYTADRYLDGFKPSFNSYLAYFASLPPSFVGNWLGYVRPIDAGAQLANQFTTFTAGGMFITNVALLNHGPIFMFFLMFFYGLVVMAVDLLSERKTLFFEFIYSTFIIFSFFWFWYGEIYFIKITLAAILIYLAYFITIKMQRLFFLIFRQPQDITP